MQAQQPDAATLVIFCRRPAPGIGKRRIAAELGDALACELAEAMLATALEDAAARPGPVVLAPADAADAGWAAGLGPGYPIVPQPAGNLGERLNAVDRALRATGAKTLIYIGSDAPALTAAFFDAARHALAASDVVLGPADDGGVTLMGARCPWPDLASLPWSTPALGSALEDACRDNGLRTVRLPQHFDVDFAADLTRLRLTLTGDRRPARRRLLCWLQEQAPAIAAAGIRQ